MVDVEGQTTWEEHGEPAGDWNYRIYLVAVEYMEVSHKCQPSVVRYSSIALQILASPEEIADFARGRCEHIQATTLEGQATWDRVSLRWYATDDDLPPNWRFFGWYSPVFSVEGRASGTMPWAALATVEGVYEWEGPAIPGRAFYRVAVSDIIVSGQTFPCQGERMWVDVVVVAPTVEERTRKEYEREILIAEATRCAKEAFTRSVSEEALPFINEFVDRRLAKIADRSQGQEDSDELASLAVVACASARADEGVLNLWSLMSIFDYGF